MKELTQIQNRRIEQIKHFVLTNYLNQEIKEFEVTECGKGFAVYAVTGRINDEGTAAEVFGRNIYHFYVGVRGAVQSIYSENTAERNACLASLVRSTRLPGVR